MNLICTFTKNVLNVNIICHEINIKLQIDQSAKEIQESRVSGGEMLSQVKCPSPKKTWKGI